jgi:tRNA-specific 2-thiouridylase
VGVVVGEHRGLALYTLGQRSGLRLGGRAGSAAAPWYVADKDTRRNALIVVQQQDHPLLLSDAFDVEQLHWLNPGEVTGEALDCAVKTRYRQNDLRCTVRLAAAPDVAAARDGAAGANWRVTLSEPARAVTPGQYAVFYSGARCLGGGVIAQRFNSRAAPGARGITYNNSQFSVEGS